MKELPRGLRLDKGYLQIRLLVKGKTYCKNFGRDSTESRILAEAHLAEKRKEIMLGKFGLAPELPQKTFDKVAEIYYSLWTKLVDSDGKLKHNDFACYKLRRTLDTQLIPHFGRMLYDEIRPIDVQLWREKRLKSVSGTTVNREQVVLSSIFSFIEQWIKTERIKEAFKIPTENPCQFVEKAKTRKRERIPTDYELKKLHWAFTELEDADGWEICKMALASVLSTKDLMRLEVGQEIDFDRAKSGVPINVPIQVLVKLNWKNWRKRWEEAREKAGLVWLQFRDLRKKGMNHLKGQFDVKLISQYGAHASVKTTENFYLVNEAEKLKPLAQEMQRFVEEL